MTPTPPGTPPAPQPDDARDAKSSAVPLPNGSMPVQSGRKYPKPPRIGMRILLLCLKPEAWADAARYPLWVTLVPLGICLFIATALFSGSASRHAMNSLGNFAAGYDKQYPPITVFADGHIELPKDAKQPVNIELSGLPIVIDTTDKADLAAIKNDAAVLITKDKVYQRVMNTDLPATPLKDSPLLGRLVPDAGSQVIDSKHLQEILRRDAQGTLAVLSVFIFAAKGFVGILWSALMILLIAPMVIIGARIGRPSLIIPRRAAYRMVAAFLVPIVLFDGIMQSAGYSMADIVGADKVFPVWFAICVILAVWTGHLARARFAPPKPPRRVI